MTAEAEIRSRLIARGYAPLPLNGKRPAMEEWSRKTGVTADEISLWTKLFPHAPNTGILTRLTPAMDIDITDPDAAQAVEELARERFEERGYFLVRFGKPPKRAVLFRTDTPFKKRKLSLIAPNGFSDQKIEILGDGQQIVVAGIHPDTKQPYSWFGGEPWNIASEELPYISEEIALEFLRDARTLLVEQFGYKQLERPKPAETGNGYDSGARLDWASLISNISAGSELHDSMRDLAAGLVGSGVPDQATNHILRAVMQASPIERNARWQERVDEIPRLVASAAEKYGCSGASPFIKSSKEFVAGFVPPEYVVVGLLQRRFIYSNTGQTGAGKTALTLRLAASAALGTPFAGRETKKVRVLYAAAENPDDVRMRWIALADHMFFDRTQIEVYFTEGTFKISEMAAKLRAEAERHGGNFGLVIIDTGPAFFEGDDENNRAQMGLHARRLRGLINVIPGGPCIVVNVHPTKNADADNLLPAGGGTFINEMDGNLTCARNDAVTEMHWHGKFRGPDFAPMSFLIKTVTHQDLKDSDGRLIPTVVCESIGDQAREEIAAAAHNDENAVLKILGENPKASHSSVATAMGWKYHNDEPNKARARRCIISLTKDKLVKQGRTGRYSVTEEGKKVLKGEAE